MASRGTLGGLAKDTTGIVQAFDAAGYEVIIIETVGAGQAEVDIASLAHTTLVIEAPGFKQSKPAYSKSQISSLSTKPTALALRSPNGL